jgi:hypothetical protein
MMKKIPFEGDAKAVLDQLKLEIFREFNCVAIAEIESFNAIEQTCVARIMYSRTILERNQNGQYTNKLLDYPLLLDCPVFFLRGGQMGIKISPSKGDNAIVLFNDRDIDNWFSGAKSGALNSNRLHSMSDAICLVGISSKENPLSDVDPDILEIFNAQAQIQLTQEKIKLANNVATLNELVGELIDELTSLQVNIPGAMAGSATLVGTTSPTSVTALNLVKDKFGQVFL